MLPTKNLNTPPRWLTHILRTTDKLWTRFWATLGLLQFVAMFQTAHYSYSTFIFFCAKYHDRFRAVLAVLSIWIGLVNRVSAFQNPQNFYDVIVERTKRPSESNVFVKNARIKSAILFRLWRHGDHTKWRNRVSLFIECAKWLWIWKKWGNFWFYRNGMKRFWEKTTEGKIRTLTWSSTELALDPNF